MFRCCWLIIIFIITLIITFTYTQRLFHKEFHRLPSFYTKNNNIFRNRIQEKLKEYRLRNTKIICYDTVGCFDLPHKRSPFQKLPENPEILNTKFYLFKRNLNFSNPEILYYNDSGKSLIESKFDAGKTVKLLIHGYLGKWNDYGNLIVVDSYLKIYDCNVIVMDWNIGARGPHYTTAAANTEIVGRQLGILLFNMISLMRLNPDDIHLIGFSLGAHVAGCASELLKKRNYLVGRITGLDAASPLFRTNVLKEKYKKLDKEDAKLVDVVHTDASPSVTDGFGLWEPIGHVDFFPNGGQEQPGCIDPKQSIVTTHFEKGLTREIACSHIRAWRLFEETLINKSNNQTNACQFITYSCRGGHKSFDNGYCFPMLDKTTQPLYLDHKYRTEIGRLGEDVRGEGVMYLVTRSSPPYCGVQIQSSLYISQITHPINGMVYLRLKLPKEIIKFQMICKIDDYIMGTTILNGLSVGDYETFNLNKEIKADIYFIDFQRNEKNSTISLLYLEKIIVKNVYGESWQFCQRNNSLIENNKLFSFVLSKRNC